MLVTTRSTHLGVSRGLGRLATRTGPTPLWAGPGSGKIDPRPGLAVLGLGTGVGTAHPGRPGPPAPNDSKSRWTIEMRVDSAQPTSPL